MHPAYSVILFTTASGAGYGLLMLLGLGAALGVLPPDRGLGLSGLGLALALVTAGLLSSTAHLGRPERAWRALSQWRTSWLSREGVLALATYVPAGVLAVAWGLLGQSSAATSVAGAAVAALSVLTLIATGMIYASLPTIRQWHQPLTVPVYIVLALTTGGILLVTLLLVLGYPVEARLFTWIALAAIVAAAALKLLYWQAIDRASPLATAGSATGLGRYGRVRQLEAPHSQPNFVMREMGYRVARKHAIRLRRGVVLLLLVVPALACLGSLLLPAAALPAMLVAVVAATLGVVVERWLFFAEAEHVVTVFYGADAA